MGLFDRFKKQDCEICGKEVGMFGYKKLKDGEICKDCVKLLSPWFDDRRHSTVDQIKRQLAAREENQRKLQSWNHDLSYGEYQKLYVRIVNGVPESFVVTSADNYREYNADIIPFEKRYFSGGANSVRGWSVRELGPGSFAGDGNFLNQSGDIKFDASIEYRTKLFWKFEGATFIDAGNIWTLRNYADQPGGQFKFNKFYKQIAVSYGMGLRLDLDFFVIRLDAGMKAINPIYESGRNRYPIYHPKLNRDFAIHFAVGYPF